MASRKITVANEGQTTKLVVSKELFKTQLKSRIALGEILLSGSIQSNTQLDNVIDDYLSWDDYNSELLKQSFNFEKNEYRSDYNHRPKLSIYDIRTISFEDRRAELKEKLKKKKKRLINILSKVDLMKIDLNTSIQKPTVIKSSPDSNLKDIFIVHGHNSEIKTDVARIIERIGLNPIILHEQANTGKTIIEKFEAHSNVGFAIILLTKDDIGKANSETVLKSRARQNVVLEMGYFIAKIGRNKVCMLYEMGVELPSDLDGLLYVQIDNEGIWKFSLVKELKAAGYNVDANKIT